MGNKILILSRVVSTMSEILSVLFKLVQHFTNVIHIKLPSLAITIQNHLTLCLFKCMFLYKKMTFQVWASIHLSINKTNSQLIPQSIHSASDGLALGSAILCYTLNTIHCCGIQIILCRLKAKEMVQSREEWKVKNFDPPLVIIIINPYCAWVDCWSVPGCIRFVIIASLDEEENRPGGVVLNSGCCNGASGGSVELNAPVIQSKNLSGQDGRLVQRKQAG